jgi:hypothetical protein
MNKEDLQDFEKQVRIELRKKLDMNDHTGIVVTTTDTPNPRIWIRFFMLFFMFEKEYLIGEQTPQQIVARFSYDLSEELCNTIYKKE